MILAIDPGTRELGWCIAFDGEVQDAGLLKAPGFFDMACAIKEKFLGLSVHTLIIEVPQFYAPGQSRADYNKLAKVTLVAGAVVGVVQAERLALPRPRRWKGTVPKKIHNQRVLASLTDAERARLNEHATSNHNIIDAIGVAKWQLKNPT